MEKIEQIAILAAGDFPRHAAPLQALRTANYVVCCDSAYLAWSTSCADTPAATQGRYTVVGDADSLSPALRASLGSRYVHVAEQEYNDLVKAMRWAVEHLPLDGARVLLLGATGLREDHTLANISHLATFAAWWPHLAPRLAMVTDYGTFTLVEGERRYASFAGQQVSLFSLGRPQPVYATGLQYPLQGQRLDALWQGSLNAATGSSFTVRGHALAVFQTHDPK